MSTASRYLVAHWRGQLPLPLSYWVNCILIQKVFSRGCVETALATGDKTLRRPQRPSACKSVISSAVAKGQVPLSSHLRHQSLGTKNLDYSPQVVGQYLQTHLGSHSR